MEFKIVNYLYLNFPLNFIKDLKYLFLNDFKFNLNFGLFKYLVKINSRFIDFKE